MKAAVKNVEGKVQVQAGKLVGNKDQQVKGISKQIFGKEQENAGNAKQAIKNLTMY